ncbi:MAG: MBL fold metallo-hydrolase [Ruminococcaceae bacterium]|jgi:glyoxylase-like metal-dependent hydrolase (beta-lactamase superfamily II)|nr:MBL fold metallo-hydrolase [Oscillospiraceae bacterium]
MKIYTVQVSPILTNCYLLCDEDVGVCALIDPGGHPARVEKMIEDSSCQLQCILLTHGHYDHCDAVRDILLTHPDVPVYIHKNDAVEAGGRYSLKFPRLDEHNQRYYAEGDTLTLGSLTISVLETPGHSSGSVCLVVGDVIFSGDTLFRATCGRTDFPDGSYDAILRSLARLGRLEGNYHVYPGHEEQTDLDYERRVNPYMQQGLRQ